MPWRLDVAMADDVRSIENLIAEYAELVDTGDLPGLGRLFAEGVFIGGAGARFEGRAAVEQMFRDRTILYADGTPRTHHVTTNVRVEVDEQAGTATACSYVTVLQALDDLPLQAVAAGRYRDRFVREGGRWRFAERAVHIHLVGDTSRHLR
ncbi:nuclear transport factor 2 family protein [Streptomyces sp. NPDC004232]|uniref:nuclear transport factor 2 family protein n=1 Tax=Streptomyces sp. NPDC004232 TaxID=3154454 RepID=UPI0033A03D82